MEAKDTVMETSQLKDIVLEKYCSPETTRRDITINDWCYDMVQAQAEITWTIAEKEGMRKVVEWVEKHGGSLDGSRVEWQAQLKVWFKDNPELLKKWG